MKSKAIFLGLVSILVFACVAAPVASTQDVNGLSTVIAGTAVAAYAQTQAAQASIPQIPTLAPPPLPSGGGPTAAVYPQRAAPCPPCTVLVDTWRFEIQEIHSDMGKGPNRQLIILVGIVTNEGSRNDLFMPTATMLLKDAAGREYEQDMMATFTAEDKYLTESSGDLNPGASAREAWAYDVPATEKTFTITAGDLAGSWGGDFIFTVP